MSDIDIRELERLAANGGDTEKQALLAAQRRMGIAPSEYWTSVVEDKNGRLYRARPWGHWSRTDAYGNSPACNCADLMRVDKFCVCTGRAWCPTHGGPRCVGGHD